WTWTTRILPLASLNVKFTSLAFLSDMRSPLLLLARLELEFAALELRDRPERVLFLERAVLRRLELAVLVARATLGAARVDDELARRPRRRQPAEEVEHRHEGDVAVDPALDPAERLELDGLRLVGGLELGLVVER